MDKRLRTCPYLGGVGGGRGLCHHGVHFLISKMKDLLTAKTVHISERECVCQAILVCSKYRGTTSWMPAFRQFMVIFEPCQLVSRARCFRDSVSFNSISKCSQDACWWSSTLHLYWWMLPELIAHAFPDSKIANKKNVQDQCRLL